MEMSSLRRIGVGHYVPPLISALRDSTMADFLKNCNTDEDILNELDNLDRNAFHYAIIKPDLLKNLLESFKADPRLKQALTMPDKKGETPIHRAARIGSVQALEILCKFDKTMGFSLIKLRSKMINRTVLHHATENASIAPVKFLLEQDEDQINVPDGWDRLPIHLASTLGKKDMVTLFMSKGTKTMQKDKGERLPIHYAAEKGSLEIVRLLIRENPNCLNIPDNQKKTPLMLAAKCGFPDVVKYLLNKPVNFEATDIYRRTAFDWAIAEGNVKVIEVFVHNENWKQIIHSSTHGTQECFAKLVESMPETAVTVMQRCITENKKDKVREYDFFCFDSKGEDQSLPSFRAILSIVESSSEDCLTHPLCVKYINRKWRKRGFGFNLLDILATLIFHICLIMYTSKIHEMLDNHRKKSGWCTLHPAPSKCIAAEHEMLFSPALLSIKTDRDLGDDVWQDVALALGYKPIEIDMKFKGEADPLMKLLNDYKSRRGSPREFVSAMYAVGRKEKVSEYERRIRNTFPDVTEEERDLEDDIIGQNGSASPSRTSSSSGVVLPSMPVNSRKRRHTDGNNGPVPEAKLSEVAAGVQNHWKKLGRALELEEDQIREIDKDYKNDGIQEQAYQMLLAWKESYPENGYDTLFRALSKLHLNGIARQLYFNP